MWCRNVKLLGRMLSGVEASNCRDVCYVEQRCQAVVTCVLCGVEVLCGVQYKTIQVRILL